MKHLIRNFTCQKQQNKVFLLIYNSECNFIVIERHKNE